nr:VanZ family protein [Pseudoduganella lurida]
MILFSVALLCVFAGCLVPNEWLPTLPNDKLLHFVAYAGLTLLAARIADGWGQFACWAAALAVAGWLVECLQRLVPGRGFSWRDQLANAAGIGCAMLATGLLRQTGAGRFFL